MVQLSVNVNKVATLRNARGRGEPSLLEAVDVCVAAGVRSITVHPRADARHITYEDVRLIAAHLRRPGGRRVELNVEGDPDPNWLALVRQVRPEQATLVPVRPGELTSEAGWGAGVDRSLLKDIVGDLQAHGCRVSMFVDAESEPIEMAKEVGADRVELFTEPFADAFALGTAANYELLAPYVAAAEAAAALGLGVNAGHDLNLHNLPLFLQVPHLDEVSIGHALMSRALFVGLQRVVEEYLQVVGQIRDTIPASPQREESRS